MTGKHFAIRCCHHWPTRFLCVVLMLLQAASVNWYLMNHLSFKWAVMYCADALVVILFVLAMYMATKNIHKEKQSVDLTSENLKHLPLMYTSWFFYAVLLDIKVVVIFLKFSTDLDDKNFFGPNTLKTTLALSGVVFITFLSTQHDVKSRHRRSLILSLTATVLFDILDGVDILENLFDKDARNAFPPELDGVIIAIFGINFLIPTVPLFTLAKTKFALHSLPKRLEIFHKFSMAFIVNLPLFVIRMVTWHGVSEGISIFLLKNIIGMGVATFEMCEHLLCPLNEKEDKPNMKSKNDFSERYISITVL